LGKRTKHHRTRDLPDFINFSMSTAGFTIEKWPKNGWLLVKSEQYFHLEQQAIDLQYKPALFKTPDQYAAQSEESISNGNIYIDQSELDSTQTIKIKWSQEKRKGLKLNLGEAVVHRNDKCLFDWIKDTSYNTRLLNVSL
jgi:hypothetical protein